MTQHIFKCESISSVSPEHLKFHEIRIDQVPTPHELLFGSAIHVIKVCYTLPTQNSTNQS